MKSLTLNVPKVDNLILIFVDWLFSMYLIIVVVVILIKLLPINEQIIT